jgi:large subunit ribosomal protein L24
MEIRKDDTVMVMAGKDRGHTGRVVNVYPRKGSVMVEGASRVKRHTRPTKANQQGGIMDKEMPIDVSNVQLVCPSCGKPTRIGFRIEDDVKVRICRKCEAEL